MTHLRQPLTETHLISALSAIKDKLYFRIGQKGLGALASSHEILGLINEEVLEYTLEVQKNASDHHKIEELKDIALAAIFGIASIQSGGTDR